MVDLSGWPRRPSPSIVPRPLEFPAEPTQADIDLAVEAAVLRGRRCEEEAAAALGRWREQGGWPRRWVTPRPRAWTTGVSIFAETCLEWPWLALAMLDAGLDPLESEYGGGAALCAVLRDKGRVDVPRRIELVRRA